MKKKADGEIELRPVGALRPHPKNPRTHPEAQVAGLAGAFEEFGVLSVPVVDEKGTILAGHARVDAAKRRGIEKLKVFVVTGWSERKKLRFMLGDNRWQELSGYDDAILRENIAALKLAGEDLDLIGYDESALARLLAEVAPPDHFPAFGEGIETEHQCPRCGYAWSGSSAPRPGAEPGKRARAAEKKIR